MKNFFAICIAATMMIGLMTGCAKPATDVTPEEGAPAETALEYEKIIVGLDDTFAPMGFRDDDGELTGLDIELAQAISAQMGIPFELQPIDWSMKETELNNKNIDLIWNGYSITPERQEKVLFTNPYLKNKQIVVTMAGSPIKTLADLSGKKVVAQAESSAVNAIEAQADIRASFAEFNTYETNDQCLLDLESGRSNAVVADEVLLRYYISIKGAEKYNILEEDFGDEEYGIGARKEDTALVDAINKAFVELKENGKSAEISTKWFGSDIIQ